MEVRCKSCFEMYDEDFGICKYCGYVDGSPPDEINHLFPGVLLADKYRVGRVLGFGGFGVTYKAFDEKFSTVVAIKEYFPAGLVTRNPGETKVQLFSQNRHKEYDFGKSRFLNEARNVARFNSHENIVHVLEFFEENNTAYIVMEFLDGCNLSEYMHEKSEKMSVDLGVKITLDICKALRDVHAQDIIHRDISPDNIFICKNWAIKLIDFGAARFSTGDEKQNLTVILKPGFAPPEQYEKVSTQGPWTDIYALGATLYYMVTDVKPEESTNRIANDLLVYPSKYNPELPEQLENTILKAMSLDMKMRFQNVDDFERALNGEKKIATPRKEMTIRRRRRLIGIGAAALAVTMAASSFLVFWNRQRADEQLEKASISMWYVKDCASAGEAYEEIAENFRENYSNINITVKGIAPADYEDNLLTAFEDGNAPTLFESSTLSDEVLENAVTIGDVLHSGFLSKYSSQLNSSLRNFYFFRQYDSLFPDEKQIPLSFNVPVLYENVTINDLTDDFVSDADVLLSLKVSDDYTALRVDSAHEEAFNVSYGDDVAGDNKLLSSTATKTFQNGTLAYCFSDTGDYFSVQDKLPGEYRLLCVDTPQVLCEFENLWSVSSDATQAQQRAAKILIKYMLSDSSQELLHTTHPSDKCALPLSKNAADSFSEVFDELAFIFENTDKYIFD